MSLTGLPKLYTLEEVANMHPQVLSLRTLTEDARGKKFRHYHYGRRRFMDDEQIKELLRSKQVTPPAQSTEDAALAKVAARRSRARRVA